ncbi:MAG TPA: hypothetical protein VLR27_12760 [Acidimicrobiales bacterium]|nr:hypothetical protein [Acidimicrobiales bacterium]
MRVLRVQLDDDHLVDLHPAVSVVSGLSGSQRTTLRRAFDAVGAGLEPPIPALIEAHGLLFDAAQADLDLLDLARHPGRAVAAPATLAASLPEDDAARLRTAERDVLLLSSDRIRAVDDLARAEVAAARPTHARLRDRAGSLRAGIARHEETRAEPVRTALDDVRDQQRMGGSVQATPVADALGAVGLAVADLGLPAGEVVRIAEDWLEERSVDAAWSVGAEVELRAIEDVLALPEDPSGSHLQDLDARRARASRAAAANAEAVDRLDELRTELARRHGIRPTAQELDERLLARLADHRPARLAGAVPLLLDGVFDHLTDVDATTVLDRLAGQAGAVQVVVVDDHPAVAAWTQAVGLRRAACVEPAARPPAAAPT